MSIEQILASSGALVTAVILVVNALKTLGIPGKAMPIISIILGIGGAYLTISHNPAIFVIVGILVTGTETGIYKLNETYFAKKADAKALEPTPDTPVMDTNTPPSLKDFPTVLKDDKLEPEPEV